MLTISGDVKNSLELGWDDLAAIDGPAQIADVASLIPKRQGTAVRLQHLLEQVQPDPSAIKINFIASDGYAVQLLLATIAPVGLLVYAIEGRPLTEKEGGPTRLLIPNSAECHTAELDFCANIKSLVKMEITG